MKLKTPNAEQLAAIIPDDVEMGATPIGEIPPALQMALNELDEVLPEDATVTLNRDWEGMPVAMVEGDPRFDILALTETGKIGYGGINLPVFFDSVDELLASRGE